MPKARGQALSCFARGAFLAALLWIAACGASFPSAPFVSSGRSCACGPPAFATCPLFGGGQAREFAWWVLGFPTTRLDKDRIGHMQVGEAFVLTFAGGPGCCDLTRGVVGVDWLSANSTVAAVTPSGRLTAVLRGIAPGEVARTSAPVYPVVATAHFGDGSCTSEGLLACDWEQTSTGLASVSCTYMSKVVVEPHRTRFSAVPLPHRDPGEEHGLLSAAGTPNTQPRRAGSATSSARASTLARTPRGLSP